MKMRRFILYTLLVSALFATVSCSKKQTSQGSNSGTNADGTTQEQSGATSADAREAFDRGMSAYRNDRDEEAVEAFKRAVEIDPDFAEAHYRLGLAYNVTKQTDEAEKAFREAVKAYEKITKRDPKDSDAFYLLGICYEKLGEWEDAIKALREAVKTSPTENDDKYYELAFASYQLAQYDEAVRALNKALEVNPNNYPAQDLLEKSKAGAERVSDFRKHQLEQMRKQQNSNANNSNANSNANSNVPRPTGTPKRDPTQPPPQD